MDDSKNIVDDLKKKAFSAKIKNYFKNLVDFSSYSRKTIIYIIIMIIIIAISAYLLYILVFVDSQILYRIVVEWFVNPIYRLGIGGVFLFIGIMALQGLLIPLPSEVVLSAAGMIWGILVGGLMGIIGSMAAGLLCFYLTRKGGRPLAEKFVGKNAIDIADKFIQKYGTSAIIIGRVLPVIPFDLISYTGGLVDIDTKKYTLGTFIGSIPRAFFYSWIGGTLIDEGSITLPINFSTMPIDLIDKQANTFNLILLIIAIVFIAIFLTYYFIGLYLKRKSSN
ncbi:MAG: TVP38/TMEM64 family protein [Candidatus Lokiarchaeota archaeon]|nr:TVP38/TMEM64 family protein [Candidatus Lokiarchaeota archaeon]